MIVKTRKEIDFAFESYKETGLNYYEGDKDSAEEAFDKCHTLYVQMMQIFLHSKNPNANKVLTSWKGRINILEADLKKLPAVTESIYS
ncbi:hypothetical protein [Parasitella parasitica]|uniref:Uncharacterized protein n=1 Tax=Parasitella parasitica TaxID=35722 RepID=A0A0B7MQ84_9FUNG|nr:hypothetical protein [Parasitella parasitica]